MPRKKKALQASSASNSKVLEPEPPNDLWEKLYELQTEMGMHTIIEQPPDTFTAAEYARRCNMNPSSARARVMKWLAAGKIEWVGRGVNNADFYRIVKK